MAHPCLTLWCACLLAVSKVSESFIGRAGFAGVGQAHIGSNTHIQRLLVTTSISAIEAARKKSALDALQPLGIRQQLQTRAAANIRWGNTQGVLNFTGITCNMTVGRPNVRVPGWPRDRPAGFPNVTVPGWYNATARRRNATAPGWRNGTAPGWLNGTAPGWPNVTSAGRPNVTSAGLPNGTQAEGSDEAAEEWEGIPNFATIQEAVDAVGDNNDTSPVTICIFAGVYRETVVINATQDGINFIGQGPSTVLIHSMSKSQVGSSFASATLIVKGSNFTARRMTIENTWKTTTDPSPAVTVYSQHTTWDHVRIVSWVDTLAIRSGNSHLFTNSYISGNTDMIWGYGRAAFVNCQIFIRYFKHPTTNFTGNVATFGTDIQSEGVVAGAVFHRCTIDGDGQSMLGRPYRNETIVVFADCYLGAAVAPEGWNQYKDYLGPLNNFREYNSRGPGARPTRENGKVLNGTVPVIFRPSYFIGRTK